MKVLIPYAKSIQDDHLSYFHGSLPVTSNLTKLFVTDNRDNNNHAAVFLFPFPSQQDLISLYNLAQPASFGIGAESVLDPSYRSARTFLSDNFAINLRPSVDMLDQIKKLMINKNDNDSLEFVRAELYRVNIYGPGDFFKEHKDTPQTGSGHFGSLVFCLPTAFEGGALMIRDPYGKEVKFDWGSKYANMLTSSQQTGDLDCNQNVEFVAFASDLTHWIEPITTGYRVTVTFHLFNDKLAGLSSIKLQNTNAFLEQVATDETFVQMQELMESKKLEGSHVLFPVSHDYSERSSNNIVLKGSDAVLFDVLKHLGARPTILFYYEHDGENPEYSDEEDGQLGEYWYLTSNVRISTESGFNGVDNGIDDLADRYRAIWANHGNMKSVELSVGGRYGNEPSLEVYHGNVCIFTTW